MHRVGWTLAFVAASLGLLVPAAGAGGGPARPPAPAPSTGGTAWISGTVLDEEGKPFPGAAIEVYREKPKGRWSAKSDAKGRFGVQGVPPGPASVVIRSKGRIPVTHALEVPATGVIGADAKLLPGVRFAGVIRDTRDVGVAGVKVLAFHQSETRGGGFSFSSASVAGGGESVADGTFEVDGLTPGETFTLRLVHPHFAPVDLPGLSSEAGGGHDHLDALLEDAGWVTGTVVDAQGRPVRGVRVSGPKDPYAMESQFMGFVFISMTLGDDERNVTDAQGRFLVGCLDAVETELTAEGPNHFPGSVHVAPTLGKETAGVSIRLDVASAAVEGVVVDADGKPVGKAQVAVWVAGRSVAETVTSDSLGRFKLTRIKSKTPVWVTADAAGFARGSVKDVALDSKSTRVEMRPLGRLRVEVRLPDGARAARVRVRILTEGDNEGGGSSWHDQGAGPLEVWLPLGSVDVMVSAPGCEERKVGTFDVESGESVDGGRVALEKKPGKPDTDDED